VAPAGAETSESGTAFSSAALADLGDGEDLKRRLMREFPD
jgi:hypothetical protein